MQQPLVSVIVPCFNHGIYLQEAIVSVESSCDHDYEIIVVNDGSTEQLTLEILDSIKQPFTKIISQTNQGLAAARNNAVAAANGKYIIPLDADNMLTDAYFKIAVPYLEVNKDIHIVYGNPEFFGIESGVRTIGKFDFARMIRGNVIDACAVYRKEVWESVGGYDGSMPAMGHEDWEFWIHSYLKGFRFHYLNQTCFKYRSREDSMAKTTSNPSAEANRRYILNKHSESLVDALLSLVDDGRYQLDVVKDYLKTKKLKSIARILLDKRF